MKIQYCSDLHLEFPENRMFLKKNPLQVVGDVLILAGDIVLFAEYKKEQYRFFWDFISKNFKQCFWIPGNHEYYHYDIEQKSSPLKENVRDNVFLVNNMTVKIENIQFVFSTLWSHIPEADSWWIERNMNDFHVIKIGGKRLSSETYNVLHKESLHFIKQKLANRDKHTVVVTHHLPTFYHYPKEYRNSILNPAFAVELYDLIEEYQADCWIYGHTHSNTPCFTIGKTKLLTNQLGYVHHGEHRSFKQDAVFKFDN